MLQALKQQCSREVESVREELQHKQRQAARILKAKAEEEAIKVSDSLQFVITGFKLTEFQCHHAVHRDAGQGQDHLRLHLQLSLLQSLVMPDIWLHCVA